MEPATHKRASSHQPGPSFPCLAPQPHNLGGVAFPFPIAARRRPDTSRQGQQPELAQGRGPGFAEDLVTSKSRDGLP